jgi:hypothetical protein
MPRSLASLVVVTALAFVPACADHGDEGILVTKNVAVTTSCSFMGVSSEPEFPEGQFSVFSPAPYTVHPQMVSRITAVAGTELQRTILIQGADVDLTFSDPSFTGFDPALTHFQAPFSAVLSPNGGTADGAFTLIPAKLLQAIVMANPGIQNLSTNLDVEILATFTVFGDMSSERVTSQPFTYPVTLCNQCIINILLDSTGAPLQCPVPHTTTITNPGNACNPFQDGVVDCCLDTMNAPVCPAPISPT